MLISGSANMTASAMERNTESSVTVRYPGIAQMYKEYIDRIKGGVGADERFSKALKGFNEANLTGIRAALAPFVDIGETLKAELTGADEVTIRMFLVGSVHDNDPLAALIAMQKAGAKVSVTVDRQQAEGTAYVRDALEDLHKAGAAVSTETGKAGGIMHDKLIFAHHPQTTESAERWTVMIGSSGLTKHVINNWNYENLLIIDDKALFDALKQHHVAGAPHRREGMPPTDPRIDRDAVVTVLRRLIPTPESPRVKQPDVKAELSAAQARIINAGVEKAGMKKYTLEDKSVWIGY